jgi:phenylalanyl-tRNA synthetase beta chain
MRFSLNWLNDYITVDLKPKELAERLSMIGLAVDAVDRYGDDLIFEVDVTTNRPDCLNHIGIARELSALTGNKVRLPSSQYHEDGAPINNDASVEITYTEGCSRYSARLIRGVKVAPSPSFISDRLQAVGVRPVNNIVDITNYVLLEYGHPLHPFDFAKIKEGRVIVRQAKEGEKIITLDGTERTLSRETIVITDPEKAIGIAGIIGGANSEITETTTDVLIESAYFDPILIRRAAKRLGLSTEASYRFERGADPEITLKALNRVCALLEKYAHGKTTPGFIDLYPRREREKETIIRLNRLNRFLGIEVPEDFVISILERLDFKLKPKKKGVYQVKIPSFRVDVSREVDLFEEVTRFYGYDKIPSRMPPFTGEKVTPNTKLKREKLIRKLLFSAGYSEIMTYSFISPEENRIFNTYPKKELLIQNPISENMALMRVSMLPGILNALRYNFARGQRNIHIFELGRVFFKKSEGELPEERETLGLAITGFTGDKFWAEEQRRVDFFDVKGIIELIFNRVALKKAGFISKENPFLDKTQSGAILFEGNEVGELGLLRPEIAERYELPEETYVAELCLDPLYRLSPVEVSYQPLPKVPLVRRDISLIFTEDVGYEVIVSAISSLSVPILTEVRVIDVYHGKGVPQGSKSITLSLYYKHKERTLTEKEVEEINQRIISHLEKELGAKPRI